MVTMIRATATSHSSSGAVPRMRIRTGRRLVGLEDWYQRLPERVAQLRQGLAGLGLEALTGFRGQGKTPGRKRHKGLHRR